MVDLSVADGMLILHVRGADKLWAFKSSLEIPLQHVAGIKADSTHRAWLVAWHQDARNQYSRSDHGRHVLSARQTGVLGRS